MPELSKSLRTVYMYLAAIVSLVVFIIGTVTLLNTALQSWVFPSTGYYYFEDPVMTCNSQVQLSKEEPKTYSFGFETQDECVAYYEKRNEEQIVNQRNMDIAFGIAMTVVSLPIWLLHMWFIRRDKKAGEA
ncbi:MAG: hypothetical protein WC604_05170 [Candidatus Gracilibacteria bacterium]